MSVSWQGETHPGPLSKSAQSPVKAKGQETLSTQVDKRTDPLILLTSTWRGGRCQHMLPSSQRLSGTPDEAGQTTHPPAKLRDSDSLGVLFFSLVDRRSALLRTTVKRNLPGGAATALRMARLVGKPNVSLAEPQFCTKPAAEILQVSSRSLPCTGSEG